MNACEAVDLSQANGDNPTKWIQRHLTELAEIAATGNSRLLVQTILDGVRPLVGKGFSEANYRKMKLTLEKLMQRQSAMQILTGYVNNYHLRGSGLGMESNCQAAIASMITESFEPVQLTPYQAFLKTLVETIIPGCHVKLL